MSTPGEQPAVGPRGGVLGVMSHRVGTTHIRQMLELSHRHTLAASNPALTLPAAERHLTRAQNLAEHAAAELADEMLLAHHGDDLDDGLPPIPHALGVADVELLAELVDRALGDTAPDRWREALETVDAKLQAARS